jgi:hypothetical protein
MPVAMDDRWGLTGAPRNIARLIGDISADFRLWLLNIRKLPPDLPESATMMRRLLLVPAVLAVLLLAGPAAADCYADYKAKQDNPLRLHYGVAQVSSCDAAGAEAELAPRLANAGWTLLNVLSVFGPEGLEERKASAGDYFLRF